MIDPLYKPLTTLPGTGAALRLGGVSCELTVTDTPPDVLAAQWMDDREVQLTVTDDVGHATFGEVLAAFAAAAREHVVAQAGVTTTAVVTLPSRDVARARVTRNAGFMPASVLAVADLRRPPTQVRRASLAVREAVPADAGELARLWSDEVDYEGEVGTLRTSTAIRAAITQGTEAAIAGDDTVLVAEHDGRIAGAVIAQAPADSQWAEARLTVHPTSYLAMASTSPDARSKGVGAGLVRELHDRHRAAGLVASTLHYTAFNPLSVPFWSQQGYRPVVTFYTLRLSAPGDEG